MSSESDFQPSSPSASEANISEGDHAHNSSRRAPRRSSSDEFLSSPRKRRRYSSAKRTGQLLSEAELFHKGDFNEGYLELYNETVASAANRFDSDIPSDLPASQIGVIDWASEEKALFFAALDRLGRDDLPGISDAIGTKTIPEVRDFLLLLQDSSAEHETTEVTLLDIPPAAEISEECCQDLEKASEVLAWFQQTAEAEKAHERYGPNWLITPEKAKEIEETLYPSKRRSASRASSRRSSASTQRKPSVDGSDPEKETSPDLQPSSAAILEAVPAAELLNASNFLALSTDIFMNSSASHPTGNPHWMDLATPLASAPSMYYTVFEDFHTLALSLTQRLIQASIFQATSRIRAQDHENIKGVSPLVRREDVLAAIGILRLPRNRSEKWRGVARRCGVRVYDGNGNNKRYLEWDEVESLLALPKRSLAGIDTDLDTDFEGKTTDTEGQATSDGEFKKQASRAGRYVSGTSAEPSGDEPEEGIEPGRFRARASRAGTPLPTRTANPSEESEDGSDEEFVNQIEAESDEDSYSDVIDESPEPSSPGSGSEPSPEPLSEREVDEIVEAHDQALSHEEESRICSLVGLPLSVEVASRRSVKKEASKRLVTQQDGSKGDWRDWTEYRAEWETFDNPVPTAKLIENRREMWQKQNAADAERAAKAKEDGKKVEKDDVEVVRELPTRSALAYASLQEKVVPADDGVGENEGDSGPDDVRPSVEQDFDAMQLDEMPDESDGSVYRE